MRSDLSGVATSETTLPGRGNDDHNGPSPSSLRTQLLPFLAAVHPSDVTSGGGVSDAKDVAICVAIIRRLWTHHCALFPSPLDVFQMAVILVQRSLQRAQLILQGPKIAGLLHTCLEATSALHMALCEVFTERFLLLMKKEEDCSAGVTSYPLSAAPCGPSARYTQLCCAYWTSIVHAAYTHCHHLLGAGYRCEASAVGTFVSVGGRVLSCPTIAAGLVPLLWSRGLALARCALNHQVLSPPPCADDGAPREASLGPLGSLLLNLAPHVQPTEQDNAQLHDLLRRLVRLTYSQLVLQLNARRWASNGGAPRYASDSAPVEKITQDVEHLCATLPHCLRPSHTHPTSFSVLCHWVARTQLADFRHCQSHREGFLHGIPFRSTSEDVAAALSPHGGEAHEPSSGITRSAWFEAGRKHHPTCDATAPLAHTSQVGLLHLASSLWTSSRQQNGPKDASGAVHHPLLLWWASATSMDDSLLLMLLRSLVALTTTRDEPTEEDRVVSSTVLSLAIDLASDCLLNAASTLVEAGVSLLMETVLAATVVPPAQGGMEVLRRVVDVLRKATTTTALPPPSRAMVEAFTDAVVRFAEIVESFRAGQNPKHFLWGWWCSVTTSESTSSRRYSDGARRLLPGRFSRGHAPSALSPWVCHPLQLFALALTLTDLGSTSWFLDMAMPVVICFSGVAPVLSASPSNAPVLPTLAGSSSPVLMAALSNLTTEVVGALCVEGDALAARSLMFVPLLLSCTSPHAARHAPLDVAWSAITTVATYLSGVVPGQQNSAKELRSEVIANFCVECAKLQQSHRPNNTPPVSPSIGYVSLSRLAQHLSVRTLRALTERAEGRSVGPSVTYPPVCSPSKLCRALSAYWSVVGIDHPPPRLVSSELLSQRSASIHELSTVLAKGHVRASGTPPLCIEDVVPYATTKESGVFGRTFLTRRRLGASLAPLPSVVRSSADAKQSGTTESLGPSHAPKSNAVVVLRTSAHPSKGVEVLAHHTAPSWFWRHQLAPDEEDGVWRTVTVSARFTTAGLEESRTESTTESAPSHSICRLVERMEQLFLENKESLTQVHPSASKRDWWSTRHTLESNLQQLTLDLEQAVLPRHQQYVVVPLPCASCSGGSTDDDRRVEQALCSVRHHAIRLWAILKHHTSFGHHEGDRWFAHALLLSNFLHHSAELCGRPSSSTERSSLASLPPLSGASAVATPPVCEEGIVSYARSTVLSWVSRGGATFHDAEQDDGEEPGDRSVMAQVEDFLADTIRGLSPSLVGHAGESSGNTTVAAIARQPVFLVMSNELHVLPWEGLYIFMTGGVDCVRSPLLGSPPSAAGYPPPHGRRHAEGTLRVLYVCNPTGDLKKTEQWFHGSFLQKYHAGQDSKPPLATFEGFTGPPDSWSPSVDLPHEQDKKLLTPAIRAVWAKLCDTTSDIFLYMGHGGGEAVVPRDALYDCTTPPAPLDTSRRFPSCVLLMGCCSARLVQSPDHFDPVGAPMAWLHAGAETVIGTLVHVSDGEIDRLTGAILESCLDSHACGGGGGVSLTRVARNLTKARRACRFPYLTGAVTVCYALPLPEVGYS